MVRKGLLFDLLPGTPISGIYSHSSSSGERLRCKTHICKRRCHRIRDHSKVDCTEPVETVCSRQHKRRVACSKQNAACTKCVQEDKEIERRARRDLQMEKERLARQEAYKKELQHIEDDLDHQRRRLKYEAEKEEQEKTIQQRRAEVESLKETVERTKEQTARRGQSNPNIQSDKTKKQQPSNEEQAAPGTARFEWEQLKKLEGAKCKILDELMAMIGLEDVKKQFLAVKSKVDTIVRQNANLKSERFSCSLLGNPGTGESWFSLPNVSIAETDRTSQGKQPLLACTESSSTLSASYPAPGSRRQLGRDWQTWA